MSILDSLAGCRPDWCDLQLLLGSLWRTSRHDDPVCPLPLGSAGKQSDNPGVLLLRLLEHEVGVFRFGYDGGSVHAIGDGCIATHPRRDPVAWSQEVEVSEGGGKRRSMPGEHGVPLAARHWGAGPVAGPILDHLVHYTAEKSCLHPDRRDPHDAERGVISITYREGLLELDLRIGTLDRGIQGLAILLFAQVVKESQYSRLWGGSGRPGDCVVIAGGRRRTNIGRSDPDEAQDGNDTHYDCRSIQGRPLELHVAGYVRNDSPVWVRSGVTPSVSADSELCPHPNHRARELGKAGLGGLPGGSPRWIG